MLAEAECDRFFFYFVCFYSGRSSDVVAPAALRIPQAVRRTRISLTVAPPRPLAATRRLVRRQPQRLRDRVQLREAVQRGVLHPAILHRPRPLRPLLW